MPITRPAGPAPVRCPHCNNMLNEDDLYCRFCGRPMVATGFDDDIDGGNIRPSSGQETILRSVGDRPRLSDPRSGQSERSRRFSFGALGGTWILGLLAGFLIVVMLISWFVLRPSIADSARDGVQEGLSRELALDALGPNTTTVTLDEVTLNEYIAASENWFDPLGDLDMDIRTSTIAVDFSLYGLSGTFTSGLTVQDGLIRLIGTDASGSAGRLIDVDEITDVIEAELRAFIQAEGRPVTNVAVDDDVLQITFASN